VRDEIDSLGGRSHPPALSLMRYLPQSPPQVGKQFSMLGLGDIVIPGTTQPPTPPPPLYKREQALEPGVTSTRTNARTHKDTLTPRTPRLSARRQVILGTTRCASVCACVRARMHACDGHLQYAAVRTRVPTGTLTPDTLSPPGLFIALMLRWDVRRAKVHDRQPASVSHTRDTRMRMGTLLPLPAPPRPSRLCPARVPVSRARPCVPRTSLCPAYVPPVSRARPCVPRTSLLCPAHVPVASSVGIPGPRLVRGCGGARGVPSCSGGP
jgi:hypothetical protein